MCFVGSGGMQVKGVCSVCYFTVVDSEGDMGWGKGEHVLTLPSTPLIEIL